ncbi:MAG: TIGR03668 family PPOX class F420-dependent oxidoreductase [Actinomycetota bacterium]
MRRLVSEARVARLATIDPDGRPNMVPFCFVVEGDTLYTGVDQKPKQTKKLRRLENIRRDPRVMVLIDHYEDDWTKAWWVRLRGSARVLEPADGARGRELLIARYPQYVEDPPDDELLAIEIERWMGWSMAQL